MAKQQFKSSSQGIWAVALSVLILQFSSQAWGRGLEPRERSRPRETCNGHHKLWCEDHYWGPINHLANGVIPELRRTHAELPGRIQAKTNELAAVREHLAGISSQIPVYERVIHSSQTKKSALSQRNASVATAISTLGELSAGIQQRLPNFLQELQEFLLAREVIVYERVQSIDMMLSAEQRPEIIEVLLFERQHLINILNFSNQKFSTLAQTRDFLIQAIDQKQLDQVEDLPAQTRTLLETARLTHEAYLGSQARMDNLYRTLADLSKATSIDLAQVQAEIESNTAELTRLRQHHTSSSQTKASLEAEIASLRHRLHTGITQEIQNTERQIFVLDTYRHCCDNLPFCHRLPDWQQEDWKYREFEAAINPDADRGTCERAGDL